MRSCRGDHPVSRPWVCNGDKNAYSNEITSGGIEAKGSVCTNLKKSDPRGTYLCRKVIEMFLGTVKDTVNPIMMIK